MEVRRRNPNVLGVIASAQALRLLTDLALDDGKPRFDSGSPLVRADVVAAMSRVNRPRRRPHRPRARPYGRHRGAAHLRPAGRRCSVAVAGLHRHRHRPSGASDCPGRGGRRGTRRLPLRHSRAPGARPCSRNLPPELRGVHQRGGRGPCGRRAGDGRPARLTGPRKWHEARRLEAGPASYPRPDSNRRYRLERAAPVHRVFPGQGHLGPFLKAAWARIGHGPVADAELAAFFTRARPPRLPWHITSEDIGQS